MNLEQKIGEWFKETWGGSLVLPNGWFGRPYDSIHQLASVTESINGLIVVLDDGHLTLNFGGVPKVEATKSELIFHTFDRLVFDWKEYDSMKPHSEQHDGGEVKIVAHPAL